MTPADRTPDVERESVSEDERVLVLTAGGRDAAITVELLAGHGIDAVPCAGVEGIAAALEVAGAAIVAEEVLTPPALDMLREALTRQPAWCDFPFVVVSGVRLSVGGEAPVLSLGNVAVLDRPVRTRTMISAVESALRGRRRQFAARREIRARDQFLAMLGHELRNPLAAIGVAAELLGRAPDELARARHRAIIDRQSRHLGRLVDDLLDVSRVTHGKVTLQAERVDLSDVLRGVGLTFEHVARSRGVRTTFWAPAPVLVVGDRLRLEQIASNLVGNALKYTPRGGTVRAEVRTRDDVAELRVVDTGIGIDAEMLPRVFDLFAQAEQGLDRQGGGMGLGLTLVQRLVTLHGGQVEARSDGVGKGSELVVHLPLAPEVGDDAELPEPAPPSHRTRRVVLVEDSDDIRDLFEELLRAAGHDVHSGVDGPHGVEVIVEARPDVAFVDVGLPGFDGYEVARRVRAQLGDDVLLVAMTGYGQASDRARALAAGFDHHLTKPIDVGAVEALVDGAPRVVTRH